MSRRPADLSQAAAGPRTAPSALRRDLLHHQQELEAQNQELRRAQAELADARDRYRDLFDRAPVGYFTLDPEGRVLDANQTAALMIGQPVAGLRGLRLSTFMATADADRWHLHRRWAIRQAGAQPIELLLRRPDLRELHGHLDCLGVAAIDGGPSLRVTLTDLTPQRQAEAARQAARRALAAQEVQRLRMARQLHDDLGQRLSIAKMELARMLPAAPVHADAEALTVALDGAVAIVRRMAAELGPLMLVDLGLAAAVDAHARDVAARCGLHLELRLPADDLRLAERDAVTLYRVFQQALALLAGLPGLQGLSVALAQEAGAVMLCLRGQLAGQRYPVGAVTAMEHWRALQDGARLLGCDLGLDLALAGMVQCTVRLPAAAASAGKASR